jgi:hypothetical protein
MHVPTIFLLNHCNQEEEKKKTNTLGKYVPVLGGSLLL